jgi:hypothetical protein
LRPKLFVPVIRVRFWLDLRVTAIWAAAPKAAARGNRGSLRRDDAGSAPEQRDQYVAILLATALSPNGHDIANSLKNNYIK